MRIPLHFPTTPVEIGEAYAKLDALDIGKTTRLMDIVSPVKKLKNYLCSIDLDSPGGIEKLNGLAQRVDALDEAKAALFTGALDAESVNGLDDVLRIADSLDDYTIISEVTSDRELGGYLVEHGFLQCPEELRPYLDYVSIGAEFYSDHGGAYELEGYVLRRSELPPCLSRVGLPEPWRDENRDEILCLELENGSQQYTLLLPADDEYLDDVCKYLGIEGFAEVRIVEVSCSIPYLSDLLPWDCVSVEDAMPRQRCGRSLCQPAHGGTDNRPGTQRGAADPGKQRLERGSRFGIRTGGGADTLSNVWILIAAGAAMFIVIGGLSLLSHHYTLNGIKSRTVGDGQHGTARWATDKEIKET